MPDRYVLPFPVTASVASNFHYTTSHQQVVVPVGGTIRAIYAHAVSVTSNSVFPSQVDIYNQPSGSALGSNTAVPVLVSPITIPNDRASATANIRESDATVDAGDVLQLRTSVNATNGELTNLFASVEIERT